VERLRSHSVDPLQRLLGRPQVGSTEKAWLRWRSTRTAFHAGPLERAHVRAYYLKEAFQLFWFYKQPKRAKEHLEKWMRSAMSSRLEPFKKFVRMLRSHLDGILSWTNHRVSNSAVEGMNNKIKSISHRSFGFRTAVNFIAAIYHCCARLPLPVER
jgi:transposase